MNIMTVGENKSQLADSTGIIDPKPQTNLFKISSNGIITHTPLTHELRTQESLRLSDDFEKGEFDWLIEDVFDKGRLHMICGPQGSGKTRFLLRLIHDWSQGLPVLGHKSTPAPFVYIDAARDKKSIKVALRSLGISPSDFFIIDWLASRQGFSNLLKSIPKETEVIFIDNLAMMLASDNAQDPSNSYTGVIKFLSTLKTWLIENDKTIIFTHTFIKAEVGHKYASPKSKVYGAQAWLQATETTLLFDEENPQDLRDPYRIVDIICKNYQVKDPNRRYRLEDSGHLTSAPRMVSPYGKDKDEDDDHAPIHMNVNDVKEHLELVKYFPEDELIDAKTLARKTSLPNTTLYRHLSKLRELGFIEKVGTSYRKLKKS